MNFFGWLKPLGKWIKKVTSFVEKYLADEMIAKAVDLVKTARDKFDTNEEKRAWVLKELLRLGLSENIASILLELAVALVKKELDKP